MNLFRVLLFTSCFICMFQACNMDSCINKSYFLKTYNRFIDDMNEHQKTFSAKDWESKDQKMTHFVDDCYASYKPDMSAEEKTSFWTKYVQYMITRHGRKTMDAIEKADDESAVAIYEEISDSMEDMDLERLLKDVYGDDIEKAVDDVLEEINKWGDQLKDWLESKN